jgi:hypothetical protein
MAGKKAKKKAEKKVVEPVADPKDLEKEPEPAPAIVEEATITVRGTAVGGTQKMTQTEYDKYCKGRKS